MKRPVTVGSRGRSTLGVTRTRGGPGAGGLRGWAVPGRPEADAGGGYAGGGDPDGAADRGGAVWRAAGDGGAEVADPRAGRDASRAADARTGYSGGSAAMHRACLSSMRSGRSAGRCGRSVSAWRRMSVFGMGREAGDSAAGAAAGAGGGAGVLGLRAHARGAGRLVRGRAAGPRRGRRWSTRGWRSSCRGCAFTWWCRRRRWWWGLLGCWNRRRSAGGPGGGHRPDDGAGAGFRREGRRLGYGGGYYDEPASDCARAAAVFWWAGLRFPGGRALPAGSDDAASTASSPTARRSLRRQFRGMR